MRSAVPARSIIAANSRPAASRSNRPAAPSATASARSARSRASPDSSGASARDRHASRRACRCNAAPCRSQPRARPASARRSIPPTRSWTRRHSSTNPGIRSSRESPVAMIVAEVVAGCAGSIALNTTCAVIAIGNSASGRNAAKSVRFQLVSEASTTGSLKWLSAVARPWPGMCLSTGSTPPCSSPSVTAAAMAATLSGSVHRPARRSPRRRRRPAHPPAAGNRRSCRDRQDRRRSAGRSSRRRGKPERRVDVVEPAEHRSGRIDRPVRRAEALHPAALLVDQDRRIRSPDASRNSRTRCSYLRRRFDIPLEQNKAPRRAARG